MAVQENHGLECRITLGQGTEKLKLKGYVPNEISYSRKVSFGACVQVNDKGK